MRAPQSELLIQLFRAAVAAAEPANCLPAHLPTVRPAGRTVVIGAGKAAAAMAVTVAAHHAAHDLGPVSGAVVTRYGHGLRPGEQAPGIEILEAGHPVPDEASVAAGARILQLARTCQPEDRCLVLLSGGASSLLVQPVPGVTLADKQALTRQLLASGAGIAEINTVRRKLSLIKGGGLGREIRAAEILLLAISDVPGDVLADIGSGPLAPDPVSRAEARAILDRYRIPLSAAIARALVLEAPAGTARGLPPVTARIVASSSSALAAAARGARVAGYKAVVLGDVAGPARAAAQEHAALLGALRAGGERTAVLSGGETTVSVRHPGGRGGRNGEYLLALMLSLGADAGAHALAADTDGIDGTGDNAGALLTPDTLLRAARVRRNPAVALAAQDSYGFFAALGDLLVTGPTRTNVNDLRIQLTA